MTAIEKRSREDWQELGKNHHLHPFTDHKELHEKRSRTITRAEGVYIYDAVGDTIVCAPPFVLSHSEADELIETTWKVLDMMQKALSV